MTRLLAAALALTLAVGAGVAGQTLDQILAQTGLDRDLVALLTVEQGGQRFLLWFVYLNERTLQSNIRPEIAEIIAPYVGQNALLIWAYSEDGANLDPGAIRFSQGGVELTLTPDVLVPVSGDLLAGVLPPRTPVVAILLLGEEIDPAQPFAIHYGDLAMASLAVQMTLAQAEAEAVAQAEATAEVQASAQAAAQAEAGAQVATGQPCEACGCNPCAWLCGWWSCACGEVQAGCDPCLLGGGLIPFLLLLLLGL
jgi:hypothetical protein